MSATDARPEVAPDDFDTAFQTRLAAWRGIAPGLTAPGDWLLQQAVVASLRVDTTQRSESLARTHLARRAKLNWDDDRREAAETLGAGLAKRPALVVRRLRQFRQGAEWLRDRWIALGQILLKNGEWTDAQTDTVLDLLGTPRDERGAGGPPWTDLGSPHALVRREVEALVRLIRDALAPLDAEERALAEQGMPIKLPAELNRLRRDEAAAFRQVKWLLEALQSDRLSAPPSPPTPPSLPADPPPPPVDFDLEDDQLTGDAFAAATPSRPSFAAAAAPSNPSPDCHARRAVGKAGRHR